MSKVSNKYQLGEIVALSVLKRKFKQYMSDEGYDGFKSSVFPKYLVVSLVMVLEELLSDCLEFVKKHDTTGLYVIDYSMLTILLNRNTKYDVFLTYLKKYNSSVKYQESVMFNYRKVVDDLESKYGDKLMIEAEAKNYISYLLVSLQYELIKLSLTIVQYANRKTLSFESLLCSFNFLFQEMYPKIKLKLDSMKQTKESEDGDDGEDGDEGNEEVCKGETVDEEGHEVKHDTSTKLEVSEQKTVKEEVKEVQEELKIEKVSKEKIAETKPKKRVVVEQVEEDDLEKELERELEQEEKPKQSKGGKKAIK